MNSRGATPAESTTSPEFFEALYKEKGDPWNFAHAPYEQDRFHRIVATLTHRRYRRALEPGCSIGTLTEKLAPLCDHVDAFDFSPTAVAEAQRRCAGLPNVSLSCGQFAESIEVGRYDLLVLSEIGYYFEPERWRGLVTKLADNLMSGSTLLAAHWLGQSPDHVQSGDAVHESLRADQRLHLQHEERHPMFRIDRFVRH